MTGDEPRADRALREAVLSFVQRGLPFRPIDVADQVEPGMDADRLRGVTQMLRRLANEGFLRPFGYRQTVAQERTPQGTVTSVLYAPPRSMPRSSRSERSGTELPTQSPIGRPFAYLGLTYRNTRRLERQTATLRDQMAASGADLVRLGELLDAVRTLVGPSAAPRYYERELAMSRDTARRIMRVAAIFRGHPLLDELAVVKPSLLYKLSEPSFPTDLREAILRRNGLVIDGSLVELNALRVRDLGLAKKKYLERLDEQRSLQRQIAALERSGGAREQETSLLRTRLGGLMSHPPEVIERPMPIEEHVESLNRLIERADRLANQVELLPETERRAGIEALKQLLVRLEGGRTT